MTINYPQISPRIEVYGNVVIGCAACLSKNYELFSAKACDCELMNWVIQNLFWFPTAVSLCTYAATREGKRECVKIGVIGI